MATSTLPDSDWSCLHLGVVAAMRMELAPLARNPLGGVPLAVTGMGIENAAREVRSFLGRHNVKALLAIGFAGALSPELKIGDVVVAREVWRGGERIWSAPALPPLADTTLRNGNDVHFGAVVTSDEIVTRAAAKRAMASRLRLNQVVCVDMESAGVIEACSERRTPLIVARCVTDLLDEDMPVDFNRCRDVRGGISARKVVLAALSSPRSLAGLFRLRERSRICADQLAIVVRELAQQLANDSGISGQGWLPKSTQKP